MFRMRRHEWQRLQADARNQRNRKNRKSLPKRRSGLRPYRKSVGSYIEWLESLGVSA